MAWSRRRAAVRVLIDLIADLRRRTHMFDLRRVPTRFHASCVEHLALVDAVARGDGAEARNIISLHIENIKLSIIDKLPIAGSGIWVGLLNGQAKGVYIISVKTPFTDTGAVGGTACRYP